MSENHLIHGTAIAMEGRGTLLRGASGAGKSDLALRLIERGAQLIADDQVRLSPLEDGSLNATTEPRLAGQLEVRGVGILTVPYVESSPLIAVFDLVDPVDVPRLPETEWAELIPGHKIRSFRLAPFEASAPDKVRLILGALAQGQR